MSNKKLIHKGGKVQYRTVKKVRPNLNRMEAQDLRKFLINKYKNKPLNEQETEFHQKYTQLRNDLSFARVFKNTRQAKLIEKELDKHCRKIDAWISNQTNNKMEKNVLISRIWSGEKI